MIINLALECACAARSSVGCILYDIIIFEIFEFQNNIVVVPGTVALRDLLARYRDSNLQRPKIKRKKSFVKISSCCTRVHTKLSASQNIFAGWTTFDFCPNMAIS